jgi:hypothetical protein
MVIQVDSGATDFKMRKNNPDLYYHGNCVCCFGCTMLKSGGVVLCTWKILEENVLEFRELGIPYQTVHAVMWTIIPRLI